MWFLSILYFLGESLIKRVGEEDMDMDLFIFDIKMIYIVIDDFLYINFLGRGGFGLVYKVVK